ncbi:MAG: AraC family transcriptional regulator [Alistipes sp.]|nr:AraC family transcriptional regulator [Alistipes sp.]
MEYRNDIIVADRLGVVPTDSDEEYLAHLLCLNGVCRYRFNEQDFEMHAGDLSIIRKRKLVERVEPSDDFHYKIIYAKPGFVELCTPQSNYGMKGSLALFLNPVMHLTPEQQIVCRRDIERLEERIADTEHRFYRETLVNAMQAAILDFFDFHARLYGENDISTQNASIMNRFLKMLEEGTYREHREVTYYADCLCVTSKYLSEVSKRVSGYAANYWINRYTILDITRQLRDNSQTFVQISDMFGFSSPAYFSRYVQQNLGVKPSDYRE